MTTAKMIVVEGIEGAGKSSVISAIKSFLDERQCSYLCTREPGGTKLGESLRALLKSTTESMGSVTELLLMYASRTELFHNVIQPALANDTWVIADRFELSSYAYQGAGRQIPLEHIKHLSALCLDDFKPDLTLYLDVSYQVSQQRIGQRGIAKDRIEKEGEAFFNTIRQGYLSFAKKDPAIKIIDAEQSLKQVNQELVGYLDKLWNQCN